MGSRFYTHTRFWFFTASTNLTEVFEPPTHRARAPHHADRADVGYGQLDLSIGRPVAERHHQRGAGGAVEQGGEPRTQVEGTSQQSRPRGGEYCKDGGEQEGEIWGSI